MPHTDDHAICIPILASLDIAETRAFYETELGFKGEALGDYLIVRRDSMELHFWLTDNPELPKNTACYIRGGQVSALYDEFKSRQGLPISDFTVRPWNMKEFYIHDPHGNLLKFGGAPDELG